MNLDDLWMIYEIYEDRESVSVPFLPRYVRIHETCKYMYEERKEEEGEREGSV